MAKTLAVAKYFNDLYMKKHDSMMNEMRMHQMLYFVQRESLLKTDKALLDEKFKAWKYGPILVSIRKKYQEYHGNQGENPFHENYGTLTDEEKQLVESIFARYDNYDDWSLNTLTHAEYSWNQARNGLPDNVMGNEEMALSAIRVDATKEKLRRKGVIMNNYE